MHLLTLLRRYLLSSEAGGRKQQVLAKESKALSELDEAVWEELSTAFSDRAGCFRSEPGRIVEEDGDATQHTQLALF